ncbi:MAG: DUF4838 domain-containing protein [Phycisphaerae bacterium]|nr:DUF4838 domain-containing protein [Phycisphaerae bacterium]
MTADTRSTDQPKPFFKTRGVVIVPDDIRTWNWPDQAAKAGLSTIATHPFPRDLEPFVKTDTWHAFWQDCQRLGIQVEHELHAMADLLPRDLYQKDPSMFPMDDKGRRLRSYNLCVHSKAAVETVCENLTRYAKLLRPTTGRHFYWIDDGKPMCRCPKCRDLSDTDQAVLLENHMLDALRKLDPKASLAHLAYLNTIEPPKQIKPNPGVFLEWAPISRRFDASIARRDAGDGHHGKLLDTLTANLDVFDPSHAQVLDYWLDESLFYRAQKPPRLVKIPWNRDVFRKDLELYAGLGIRHVTTFAVKVNAQYVKQFGEPPLDEYGQGLREVGRSTAPSPP